MDNLLWDGLSMRERAAYIRDAVSRGIFDIDNIRLEYNEFKKGGNTLNPPLKYIYDELPRLLREAGLDVKVSSGYRRAEAVGTAGNRSWHPRHSAVDIVPLGNTTFEDIEYALHNNPVIRLYMLSNNFGLLDESGRTPESRATMHRTGATGPHFHIGRDSKPAALYRLRVGALLPTGDRKVVYFTNPFLPLPEPELVIEPSITESLVIDNPIPSLVLELRTIPEELVAYEQEIPEVVVTPERKLYIRPDQMLALMNEVVTPYTPIEYSTLKPLSVTDRLALINSNRVTLLLKDLEDSIIRNNLLDIQNPDKLRRDAEDLRFYRNMSALGGNLFSGEENHSQQMITTGGTGYVPPTPSSDFLYNTILNLSNNIMTGIHNWGDDGYTSTSSNRPEEQHGGIAQRTFLTGRKIQEEEFKKHGFIKDTSGNYGLVKKAVGNNKYPIWQRTPDEISRDKLIAIGNTYEGFTGIPRNKAIIHGSSYPTAYYVDPSTIGFDFESGKEKTPKFYAKSWDLNDYGGKGGSTAGILGKMLDFIGNPVVQTTGYIDITDSRLKKVDNMLEDYLYEKGLVKHRLDANNPYGAYFYGLPEVTVTGKKRKALGGNLFDGGGYTKTYIDGRGKEVTFHRFPNETDEQYEARYAERAAIRERNAATNKARYERRRAANEAGAARLNRAINAVTNVMEEQAKAVPFTSQEIQQATEEQRQEKLDKWGDYKKGINATVTAAELGLSGASLLGAYANWRNWATAANATKRGIANLLQKAQLPMQVTGTAIDGYQTYDANSRGNDFGTYYNGASSALGVAGSLGAADLFNPKVDRVLDVLGIIQNSGDFIKFGYDSMFGNKKAEGGPMIKVPPMNPIEYMHWRFPVTELLDVHPLFDSGFTPRDIGDFGDIEYMLARYDNLPYYNNYSKPDSLKGKSVIVYNDRLGEGTNEAIALDALSHGLRELDNIWRELYIPTLLSAFREDANYFADLEGIPLEYRQEYIDGFIDGKIRDMVVKDSLRRLLNYQPKLSLILEYRSMTPELQNALTEAYSYIFPTLLDEIVVNGKRR